MGSHCEVSARPPAANDVAAQLPQGYYAAARERGPVLLATCSAGDLSAASSFVGPDAAASVCFGGPRGGVEKHAQTRPLSDLRRNADQAMENMEALFDTGPGGLLDTFAWGAATSNCGRTASLQKGGSPTGMRFASRFWDTEPTVFKTPAGSRTASPASRSRNTGPRAQSRTASPTSRSPSSRRASRGT